MTTAQKALEAVYAALEELNRLRPADKRLARNPDTPLAGSGGLLDSLGLVTFIVAVEQQVEDRLGRTVTLTDDALLADDNGVFSTVATLATHIATAVGENGDG